MYKNIDKLISVSKDIKKFLAENNAECVDRKRKIDICDAVTYKFLYTKYNTTQEKATIKLNNLKRTNVSRQALVKKENKLTHTFYDQLAAKLMATIDKNFKKKRVKQIIAVDGTYPTFLSSLTNDNFTANKKGTSVTPLITGLFNVTYNFPVAMELAKTKNERQEFFKFLKNKTEYENTIFVFDKGYQGDKFFKDLDDKELQFICRIKDNSNYIKGKSKDYTVRSSLKTKLRIVKYKIDKQEYHIATNNFDMSANEIKHVYHQRWSV